MGGTWLIGLKHRCEMGGWPKNLEIWPPNRWEVDPPNRRWKVGSWLPKTGGGWEVSPQKTGGGWEVEIPSIHPHVSSSSH